MPWCPSFPILPLCLFLGDTVFRVAWVFLMEIYICENVKNNKPSKWAKGGGGAAGSNDSLTRSHSIATVFLVTGRGHYGLKALAQVLNSEDGSWIHPRVAVGWSSVPLKESSSAALEGESQDDFGGFQSPSWLKHSWSVWWWEGGVPRWLCEADVWTQSWRRIPCLLLLQLLGTSMNVVASRNISYMLLFS